MSQETEQQESDQPSDIAVPDPQPVPEAIDPLVEFGIEVPSAAPVISAERNLEIGGSVAFVLDVASIDKAERFYHELFEMDVVCRAWRQDDGSWIVSSEQIDWGKTMINGYYPELVVLQRPDWRMVLHGMGRGQVLKSPKAGDATVPVSPATLRRLRAKLLMKSYTVVQDEPERFAFRDPYAVVWTLVQDESLATRS